jgi:PAS domain S-box-containing protein
MPYSPATHPNPVRGETDCGEFVDISVKSQALPGQIDQHAAEALARLEATLSSISDFAYSFDRDGRFTYVNKALLDLWGLTLNQALGKDFFDLQYPPDLAAKLQRQIQQVFHTRQALSDETPYVSPTGVTGYYEYIFAPVFGPDGAVQAVAGSTRDITRRKQAEDDRERSEQRLARDATLLANVRDAVIVTDLQGIVTFWNEGAARLFGFQAAEVLGRPNAQRFPEAIRPKVEEWTQLIASGEAEFSGEWLDYRKDGSTVWIEAATRRINDPAGNPIGIMGVSRDISDRKRNEEILRENTARFRQLADAMPQIVFAATPDGNVDYFNRKWYAYTGLPEGSVGNQSWQRVHEESESQRVLDTWAQSLRSGHPYEIEYRLRRADGAFRWHLGRALPVRDDSGNIVRWFGTNTDIHDSKLLQEQNQRLLESERAAHAHAEAANRAKDTFLAVLSHELRTPLSPVIMAVTAMEIDSDLPKEFQEELAMVRRNLDLEVKLIDDLLDLSRVTSGKLRLHPQPVHVHDILRHVLQSSASDLGAKRLNLTSKLAADNDRLIADPARLQQVFWNVIRNAVKFTPQGGDISVRTWNDPAADGRLFVEITDSGAGIPPDLLPRIFEAFEQGDLRTTRQSAGLGLGLAIAKAVVEMHGGTIQAASEGPGRGATFTVRLDTTPAAAPESGSDADTPVQAAQSTAARPRVLLVEDHPDSARTLARLLQSSGYDVRLAHNVAAALQLAAAHPFDIMVSDVGLPDGTGHELMEQIRARHGLKGIALSGYGMEDDLRRGRDAGFVDYVVKPVNVAHLDTIIRRHLAPATATPPSRPPPSPSAP